MEFLVSSVAIEQILKILLAAVCGGVIGYERESHSKNAGMRTHIIICLSSALLMIVSKYGFYDVVLKDLIRLDPSRVAAGVAGSIGFLGAGVILTHKEHVVGLTTSAGIWATSGIGMAIGAGLYAAGVFTAVLIFALQAILYWRKEVTNPYAREHCIILLSFPEKEEQSAKLDEHINERIKSISEAFAEHDMRIRDIHASRAEDKGLEISLKITYPRGLSFGNLVALINSIPDVQSFDAGYKTDI